MEASDAGRSGSLRHFRAAYAEHRAREGRGPLDERGLLALPYLTTGRFAREWRVRARSFERLVEAVLRPLERRLARSLRVLDLGAGNGWLCHRLARLGHRPLAVEPRTDTVDGLGAAAAYRNHLPRMFDRVAASFDALPLRDDAFDAAVFNASLHYAIDLRSVLDESARVVRGGGHIAIVDSPFYPTDEAGEAMREAKRRSARRVFGDLHDALGSLPFIDYLTPDRLTAAGRPIGLRFRRVRVRYPLWYELRQLRARLRRARSPSRFDVWYAEAP